MWPNQDYTWLVEEIKQNLPLELDFRAEAANAERCRNNFASDKCAFLSSAARCISPAGCRANLEAVASGRGISIHHAFTTLEAPQGRAAQVRMRCCQRQQVRQIPRMSSHTHRAVLRRSKFGRHVHVPEVDTNKSSSRILTMEFVAGATPKDRQGLHQLGFSSKKVLLAL